MVVEGNIVDIHGKEVYQGKIYYKNGLISSIEKCNTKSTQYILPGLVDSHVHIESSMTIPTRFAKMVVPRGTVAVVSDPHEIANVLGKDGVEYMMKEGQKTPLKCFFGVPSCVPATDFESSGGRIDAQDVDFLFSKGAYFLAEMMNFPGVVFDDSGVYSKLDIAKKYKKPIDGHAPGLRGEQLKKYVFAGISTDHECSTLEEALEKIKLGMMIQVREGSAARNFEALHTLIKSHPDQVMLCTDDSHPDLIMRAGHIDRLVRLALGKGYSIFEIYKAAVLNPVNYYQLPVGLLREGDRADFIIVDNLVDFNVKQTYIDGVKVAENNEYLEKLDDIDLVNNFNCDVISRDDLIVKMPEGVHAVKVIDVEDGELLTGEYLWRPEFQKTDVVNPDVDKDILKIVVVNRYQPSKPVVGFIRGFGLKYGAIGGSVAHDSHNIVALGCDDQSLFKVINKVIELKGGLVACDMSDIRVLPLPVAGIMSDKEGSEVAKEYAILNEFVFNSGSRLKTPFMTLAFMSLLVIPKLKIGDKGLFDVTSFSFTDLFVLDE